MTFGQKLKKLRADKGLSQFAMHLDTGIAQGTIAKWEKSVFIPSVPSLIKVANYFDMTVEELMEGVEIENAD